MEKATATCTCRKCGIQFIKTGNTEHPAYWKEWAETAFTTCSACEAKESAAHAKANSFPDLYGSTKQVAWAMRLRRNFVNYLRSRLYNWPADQLEAFITWVITVKVAASWWIDELGHGGNCEDDVTEELVQDWNDDKAAGLVAAEIAARPEQPEKLYEEVTMSYQQYKAGYKHCITVPGSYDATTKTIVVRIPV